MKTTLYRHFDAYGTLLYVGVTGNMPRRTSQHKAKAEWFDRVAITKTEEVPSRKHALALEQVAIRFEKPLFNKTPGRKPPAPKSSKGRCLTEFQGPKRDIDAALEGLTGDQKKALLLVAQFLHLMPSGVGGKYTEEIGIDRFVEVANSRYGDEDASRIPPVQTPLEILPTPEASA